MRTLKLAGQVSAAGIFEGEQYYSALPQLPPVQRVCSFEAWASGAGWVLKQVGRGQGTTLERMT